MHHDLPALVAAIRAQPWAILPEYLDAIEAIAARALTGDLAALLQADGHEARLAETRLAVAAAGSPLAGATMTMVRNGVATVPVLGPIFPRATLVNSSAGGTSLDAIMRDFRVALASEDVQRVVLLMDTPGGVVSGLAEAADAIHAASKPVTAFVTGMMASAGYWLGSQAREVVIDRAASVGSIGVVASVSRQEAADASGRRMHEVVSSGAPAKRPDPTTEEGRAAIQAEVDAIERVFVGDVARGRRVSEAAVLSRFGQGAMVSGQRAVDAGMADRIGTLEEILGSSAPVAGNREDYRRRRSVAALDLETRRRAAERSI